MNVNNPPPFIRPWHPGVSVPPHQWDRSEQNRINALHKKQRYSFPPSLSSTPLIPSVPPTWNNVSYQLPFACQLDTLTPNVASSSVTKHVVLSDISNTCLQSPVKKKVEESVPSPKYEVKPKSKNPPPREYCMFSYTFQKFLSKGWMHFCCTYHHNTDCNKCTAKIKVQVNDNGSERILAEGEHATGCEARNGHKAVVHEGCQDVTTAMKQFVEERMNHDDYRRDPPEKIWNDTVAHFCELVGNNFSGLSKGQVKVQVYNARECLNGGDAIAKVEQMYAGDKNKAFLRHNLSFVDEKQMQRIMCFGLPRLMNLLLYPLVSVLIV